MLALLQFAFMDGWHFFGCVLLLFIVGFYISRTLKEFIKLTYNVNKFMKFTDEELNEFIKSQGKAVIAGNPPNSSGIVDKKSDDTKG